MAALRMLFKFGFTTRLNVHYCLLISSILMTHFAATLPHNQLFGIKYISYDNFDGTLATGDCCDEPGKKAGSCTPDLCDTVFETCGRSGISKSCDVFTGQHTPVTYNDNNYTFGSRIGNGHSKTLNLIITKFPFIKSNINMRLEVLDSPEEGKSGKNKPITRFSFLVDWVDPVFSKHPKYRRMVLNDTRMQLVVDIVSQCSKHYYTDDCSVYCTPANTHQECLDNGTINCMPGWTLPKCLTMIDYCPGNLCQHGSTCVPVLLNYTCTCNPGFSGRYCETSNETTSTTTSKPLKQTTTTKVSTASANQSRHSTSSDDSDDDHNVVALTSGLTVGLLFLLAILVGVAYYIIGKKKERSHVAPEDKQPPLKDEENQVSTSQPPMTTSDVNGIEITEEIQRIEAIRESLNSW